VILADTSIWIQHFRRRLPELAAHLNLGQIRMHPIVIGELATGTLANRQKTLALLHSLPHSSTATADECLALIETHSLYGKGVGWSDVQLLAAALLSGDVLWTLDTRLEDAAKNLGIAYTP